MTAPPKLPRCIVTGAICHHRAATMLLEAAEQIAPGSFALNRVRSGFLAAQGMFEHAESLAVTAVGISPGDAEARLHLAGVQFARNRHTPAIPHILAALGSQPEHAPAWHMLSIALFAAGQRERAVAAIERAVALRPEHVEYRLHLASLLTARARYGDSLTVLDEAAALAPEDARIPRAASGNHEALGDITAAYREAMRACDRAPEDADIAAHCAQLAKKMGLFSAPDATIPADWAEPVKRVRRQRRRGHPGAGLRKRGRIIYALVLRDMRTRHGRSQLGYLWSVFEPISHLLTLGVIFSLLNQAPPPVGHSLFEFYCTGLLPYLLFAHISGEVMGARAGAGALLLLPTVKTTDIVCAKVFLNLLTEIMVGIIVFTGFGMVGYRTLPAHLFICAGAVLLLSGLAMGVGLINMVIQNFFHAWESFFSAIVRLLYFASGIYYSPISMPDEARNLLKWNPVLQGVEVFRAGFFDNYHPFWIEPAYLTFCVLTSLLLGLGAEQMLRRHMRRLT